MTKCIICKRRPSRNGGYCTNCASKIEADKRCRQADSPVKFLTYRGHVVGLCHNNGRLTPRLLRRNAETLPRTRTLDLNTYIDGFTREEIKRFKACVLQCANA